MQTKTQKRRVRGRETETKRLCPQKRGTETQEKLRSESWKSKNENCVLEPRGQNTKSPGPTTRNRSKKGRPKNMGGRFLLWISQQCANSGVFWGVTFHRIFDETCASCRFAEAISSMSFAASRLRFAGTVGATRPQAFTREAEAHKNSAPATRN